MIFILPDGNNRGRTCCLQTVRIISKLWYFSTFEVFSLSEFLITGFIFPPVSRPAEILGMQTGEKLQVPVLSENETDWRCRWCMHRNTDFRQPRRLDSEGAFYGLRSFLCRAIVPEGIIHKSETDAADPWILVYNAVCFTANWTASGSEIPRLSGRYDVFKKNQLLNQ